MQRLLTPTKQASRRLISLTRSEQLIHSATRSIVPAISTTAFRHCSIRGFASESKPSTGSTINHNNGVHSGSNQQTVSVVDDKVHVQWANGTTSRFHSFWLRDHCHCPDCYHQVTKQRLVNTFKIPRNITPKSIVAEKEGLSVTWNDGDHKSVYPFNWLQTHSYDPKMRDPLKAEGQAKVTWDNSIAKNLPEVDFKSVMETESGLAQWLNNIHVYGFSYVKGVPVNTTATEQLARRISFIRETHYGGFWDFTSDLGHGDTAYTDLALGAHTDTTYFTDPVGLQMFHLLQHDGQGGDNLLVDGFHVAQELKSRYPESYKVLSEIRIPAHSAGDQATHIVPSPRFNAVLNHDPNNQELIQVRFNNDDRSTLSHLDSHQVEKFYDALFHWNQILTEEKNLLWTKFQPGRVLIFDNWRCLHGRSAFTGKRRMCGVYVNWDDYRSKWRTLNTSKEQLAQEL